MNKKILFCCILRDCAPILEYFLSQLNSSIENLSDSYDFYISIHENDSNDSTVEILNNFKFSNKIIDKTITSEKLNTKKFGSEISNERIKNISTARNKCIENCKNISEIDYIIWSDVDYAWSDDCLKKLIEHSVEKDYDIASGYSLHADIQRPHMELYDKWATRYKKHHNWWCCPPYEYLHDDIKVYSTFNGLCFYKSKPFIDGLRFCPKSSLTDEDVEHISICEGFAKMNMNKIYLIKDIHVLHFSDLNNFPIWLESQKSRIQQN